MPILQHHTLHTRSMVVKLCFLCFSRKLVWQKKRSSDKTAGSARVVEKRYNSNKKTKKQAYNSNNKHCQSCYFFFSVTKTAKKSKQARVGLRKKCLKKEEEALTDASLLLLLLLAFNTTGASSLYFWCASWEEQQQWQSALPWLNDSEADGRVPKVTLSQVCWTEVERRKEGMKERTGQQIN